MRWLAVLLLSALLVDASELSRRRGRGRGRARGRGWRRWKQAKQGGGSSPELLTAPLPNCSVVFFHHVEKTAGTTLRSVFQRQAQLGLFDLFSFVNRQHRLSMQILLHRLDSLLATPGGLANLRLLVEIHVGADLSLPYHFLHQLPDLLFVRDKLRAAGCRCNLVSLLRNPLLQQLSWHAHFCAQRVPLCFWLGASSCQTRLALGITCHDSPRVPALQPRHEMAAAATWAAFDLVGVTEDFDGFVLLLSELAGLRSPAYRMMTVGQHTLARATAQRGWTNLSCAKLVAQPPAELLALIGKRLASSTPRGGSRHTMECHVYGPCEVPGLARRDRPKTPFEAAACNAVTATQVLTRLCGRVAVDERLYLEARRRFEAQVTGAAPRLDARARLRLRAANERLARRVERQAALPTASLERVSGQALSRRYRASSGGGVPWVVDEHAGWYKPHERARFSCVNCSGDVVPEFDLIGCWPLWPQFGPDELAYRCSRRWSADPGDHNARGAYAKGVRPIPCWQTCWERIVPGSDAHRGDGDGAGGDAGGGGARHCTAACPPPASVPSARAWRDRWERERREWEARSDGAVREVVQRRAGFDRDGRDFMRGAIWGVF